MTFLKEIQFCKSILFTVKKINLSSKKTNFAMIDSTKKLSFHFPCFPQYWWIDGMKVWEKTMTKRCWKYEKKIVNGPLLRASADTGMHKPESRDAVDQKFFVWRKFKYVAMTKKLQLDYMLWWYSCCAHWFWYADQPEMQYTFFSCVSGTLPHPFFL